MFEFAPRLLDGLWVTVRLTVLGALLGIVVSLVVGLGRASRRRPVRWLSGVYVEVFRGTSLLVQMFWLFYALPSLGIRLEAFPTGVLALGLNMGGYGAEAVRGAIEAVPRGQRDAGIALNFTERQRTVWIILPQALALMLPPMGNNLIELLKGSALVSLITVPDITFGAQLLRSSTGRTLELFLLLLLAYFGLAYAITILVRAGERLVARRFAVESRGRGAL